MNYIDLNRTFAPIRGNAEISLEALEAWGRRAYGAITWAEMLALPRAVVLAEAGSGKTREFEERVAALENEGEAAFFVAIEQIAERGFLKALGRRAAEFAAWKASSRPGWIFLDSVDEAKLRKDSFSTALSDVGEILGEAAERASVLLSCRGTDWAGARDLKLFADHLPPPGPREESVLDADEALLAPLDRETRKQARAKSAEETSIPVFAMAPLSRAQQRAFLVGRQVDDVEAFETAVAQRGLQPLTERPGDLAMLVSYWNKSRQFGSLTEMMEQHVTVRLRERSDRADADLLTDLQSRQAAERLAASMTLAHTLVVQGESDDPERGASLLDVADVFPELTSAQRSALLRRAIFAPTTYGRSRFHHRSAVEFLTASWFRRLHTEGRLSEAAILSVFTRRQYGVTTVPPSLRPAAAWLAPHCSALMQFMLRHVPLALMAFGDPAALPVPARETLLKRYAELDAAGDVAPLSVDQHALWMFADQRLAGAIREAWTVNRSSDFRLDLLRLIEARAITGLENLLRATAMDTAASRYSRIVAVRALLAVGDLSGLAPLAAQMLADPAAFGPRLAPDLTIALYPSVLSTNEVVQLIARTPPARPYQVEGYGYALEALFARCLDAQARAAFIAGVADVCLSPPLKPYETISEAHQLLARRTGGLARAAVIAADQDGGTPGLISLLQVAERADLDHHCDEDEPSLAALVRERPDLQQDLFLADVRRNLEAEAADPGRVPWVLRGLRHRFWHLTAADAGWLEAGVLGPAEINVRRVLLHALYPVLNELSENACDALADRLVGEPVLSADLAALRAPIKASAQTRQWQKREAKLARRQSVERAQTAQSWQKFRDRLQANPRLLDDPAHLAVWPGPNELRLLTTWLHWATGLDMTVAPTESSRLEPAFGPEVTEAYRRGIALMWRQWVPERPEISPDGQRTVKHAVVLAIGGLNLEAQRPSWLPSLSRQDAARVASHICFDDQDVPEWLNALLQAKPAVAGPVVLEELEREWLLPPDAYGRFLGRAEQSLALVPVVRAGLLALVAAREAPHPRRVATIERILRRASLSPAERQAMTALARGRLRRHRSAGAWDWRLAYLSLLFELDFPLAVSTLAKTLAREPEESRAARGEEAFSALFGIAHGSVSNLARGDVPTLATLLRLAYGVVQAHKDQDRDGGFTPNTRDDAESGRNAVLSALMDKGGELAYRALQQMIADDLVGARAHRFNQIARQVADVDAERPAWTAQETRRYEAQAGPIKTGGDLLDLASDMLDDIALRFSDFDYSSRAVVETAEDEFAVQNYLAEQLELRARNRCLVAREKQIVNDTRPDISLTSTSAAVEVAIEIKHGDKSWSIADLRDALHRQLTEDYLRVPQRRHGLLVITNHRSTRFWRDTTTRKRVTFADLIAMLQAEADAISNNRVQAVTVRVRGLDAVRRKKA